MALLKPICLQPFMSWTPKPGGWRACTQRHLDSQPIKRDPWNSEYQREFRKKMFSEETVPDTCKGCMHYRSNSSIKFARNFDESRYDPETGMVTGGIDFMQYFMGNKCNLVCEMCDAEYSDINLKMRPERNRPKPKIMEMNPVAEIIFHQPKTAEFYGGEPLIYRHLAEEMCLVLENTNARINLLTNGSKCFHKLGLWEKVFHKHPGRIRVVFSVDGTKETNEFIRKGLKHEVLEKNIDDCIADPAVQISIHSTISTMNLDNVEEMYKWWINKASNGNYDAFIDFQCVITPHDMAIHNLPKEVRLKYADRFEKFMDEYMLGSLVKLDADGVAANAMSCMRDMILSLRADFEPAKVYGANLLPIEVKVID